MTKSMNSAWEAEQARLQGGRVKTAGEWDAPWPTQAPTEPTTPWSTPLPRTAEDLLAERLAWRRADEEAKRILDEERGQLTTGTEAFRDIADGDWLWDEDEDKPPLWGTIEAPGWPAGEPTMIAAMQSMGKTTLALLLCEGLLGLGPGEVLNRPVRAVEGRILYLASDRPKQAKKAFRRLLKSHPAEVRPMLKERLRIWRGPLPVRLEERPQVILEMMRFAGASVVIIDGVKDMLKSLNSDESGIAYNTACQWVVAHGGDLLDLGHMRKKSKEDKKEKTHLDASDIYGSTHIVNGHGSIFILQGEPGDTVVDLTHAKPAGEKWPNLRVHHDTETGRMTTEDEFDVYLELRRSPAGLTASEMAVRQHGKATPDDNLKAQTYRALEKLCKLTPPLATKAKASVLGGKGGSSGAVYHAVVTKDTPADHGRPNGSPVVRPEPAPGGFGGFGAGSNPFGSADDRGGF